LQLFVEFTCILMKSTWRWHELFLHLITYHFQILASMILSTRYINHPVNLKSNFHSYNDVWRVCIIINMPSYNSHQFMHLITYHLRFSSLQNFPTIKHMIPHNHTNKFQNKNWQFLKHMGCENGVRHRLKIMNGE
jgi:hypothetical protein